MVRTGSDHREVQKCNLQVGRHTFHRYQKGGLKTLDCLSYPVVAKSIERIADHAYSITDKAIKLKDKTPKESF
jgi:phosphate uptake regulator